MMQQGRGQLGLQESCKQTHSTHIKLVRTWACSYGPDPTARIWSQFPGVLSVAGLAVASPTAAPSSWSQPVPGSSKLFAHTSQMGNTFCLPYQTVKYQVFPLLSGSGEFA